VAPAFLFFATLALWPALLLAFVRQPPPLLEGGSHFKCTERTSSRLSLMGYVGPPACIHCQTLFPPQRPRPHSSRATAFSSPHSWRCLVPPTHRPSSTPRFAPSVFFSSFSGGPDVALFFCVLFSSGDRHTFGLPVSVRVQGWFVHTSRLVSRQLLVFFWTHPSAGMCWFFQVAKLYFPPSSWGRDTLSFFLMVLSTSVCWVRTRNRRHSFFFPSFVLAFVFFAKEFFFSETTSQLSPFPRAV